MIFRSWNINMWNAFYKMNANQPNVKINETYVASLTSAVNGREHITYRTNHTCASQLHMNMFILFLNISNRLILVHFVFIFCVAIALFFYYFGRKQQLRIKCFGFIKHFGNFFKANLCVRSVSVRSFLHFFFCDVHMASKYLASGMSCMES